MLNGPNPNIPRHERLTSQDSPRTVHPLVDLDRVLRIHDHPAPRTGDRIWQGVDKIVGTVLDLGANALSWTFDRMTERKPKENLEESLRLRSPEHVRPTSAPSFHRPRR